MHYQSAQWLPTTASPAVEGWARDIRAEQWGEMFALADAAAMVASEWGMEANIATLRTERGEKGQHRRNWDCAAEAVLKCAERIREERTAEHRREKEAAASERARMEASPFAALAALKGKK